MPFHRGAPICLLMVASFSTFAQELDPFASTSDENSPAQYASPGSVSLDFIHQSTYIPDVIVAGGSDEIEHQTILDSIAKWEPVDGTKFKLRGIVGLDEKRIDSRTDHNDYRRVLEAYYEQQFSGGNQVFSVGRKQLGWSSGFQWRPADLIENGFTTKNVDTLDPSRYRGVDQVRYDFNGTETGFSAVLSNRERRFFDGYQFATRLDFKSAPEVSLLYAVVGSYSKKYGIVLDSNLPMAMTAKLEAVRVEIDREMLTDADHFGVRLESLSGASRYEDIYLGLTKFIDDKRRINFEYFYSGRGLNAGFSRATPGGLTPGVPSGHAINSSIFAEEYLGKHYIYLAGTGYIDAWKLQIKPSVLMNTDDRSYIGALSFNREIGGNSELTFNVNTFHGDIDSEFGLISRSAGFSLSYILHMF